MTGQHPDQAPEPDRANGRGEFFPEKHAEAMEWEKFPQPRGWSLLWDGSSISAIQEFNTRFEPPLDTIVKEDTPPPHKA